MKTPADRLRMLFTKTVLKVYGTRCMCCGCDNLTPHVDHIFPQSIWKDRLYDPNNAQVLCPDCNRIKGQTVVDHRPHDDPRQHTLRIEWCLALCTRINELQERADMTVRLAKKGKL